MPCNSDYMREPPPSVLKTTYDSLLDDHNKLTHEADVMRELLLSIARVGELTPWIKEQLADMEKDMHKEQVKHRKVDLKRLERTFTKSKDAARLALVWAADPEKPLEPQLGFDPDEF